MNKFYITSIGFNVLGDELDMTLCQYENKIEFRQPHFERAWSEVLFDSELDALNKLQDLYPDRRLTILEDTGKVLSTWGHETGLTSMKIRKEKNND